MAQGDTPITLIGNLVADPELKYTNSGTAVANIRVASTPRVYRDGQWVDGEGLFLTCKLWRDMAENATETLTKGMRVIVHGNLRQRSYETREGERRTVFEVEADEIGPSLRFATAQVSRTAKSGGGRPSQNGGFGGGSQQGNAGGGFGGGAPQSDPWGSAPSAGSGMGGEEPPF